jgi:hypothetical protein
VRICQHSSAYVSIRQRSTCLILELPDMRQPMSAYVSIRQHTRRSRLTSSAAKYLSDTSATGHTSAYVSLHQPTSAYVSIHVAAGLPAAPRSTCLIPALPDIRQPTSAYVSLRQHTRRSRPGLIPALPDIRQPTSAYVSLRQHTRRRWLTKSCVQYLSDTSATGHTAFKAQLKLY